jgi:hypothetical protein
VKKLRLASILTLATLTAPILWAENLSPEELEKRAVERRAVEAVIWGMPAVNYDMMFQAMVRDAKAGPGSNKIVYWSRPFWLEKPNAHAQSGHDLLDALH